MARPVQELTLAIVGIDFPNADRSRSNRRMELLLCPPGEVVQLRLEPRNPHDPNAVGVWSARNVQLGYLSAERAGWIGGRIRAGEAYEVVFQALHGQAGYVRIRFGGGLPTLPTDPAASSHPPRARSRAIVDPDAFYPDEEGPDWGA